MNITIIIDFKAILEPSKSREHRQTPASTGGRSRRELYEGFAGNSNLENNKP